ncbi:SsgA family sporulation/cell division regulator [Streptomyces sp. S.PB5]|uniref:SsgA family sporulation/cell division regulator n=1 Tax=Streptomyces sp. S.PB5 TaxID=3020844 RepID=UPI0025AF8C5D|nr:SsgA family sporulation/cell division regulator [Streptomyces sp. S.PB5]
MDQRREHAARAADPSQQDLGTETSGRIRHDIRGWLASAGTLRIPLRARFDYDPADPYVVRLSFCLPNHREVTWIFGRDLLADGLHLPSGAGDICVAPKAERILQIALTPLSGAALIEVRRARVGDFLKATERIVPRGQEKIDIDAFLSTFPEDD